MLNKLSAKQEALMGQVREEWVNFCFGGNYSVNREEATEGINWLYKKAKLKNPMIFFVDSPIACQLAIPLVKVWFSTLGSLKKIGDQVRDQVWNQVRDQVEDQVRDQVWNQVRDQVGDQVHNQVHNQVRDQVWNQVGDQVEDQVRDQVWNQVEDQVRDQVWNQVRDQVGDQVRDQVHNQVHNPVWNQVWNQVRDQVENQVRDQMWNQVRDQLIKTSFYSFCYESLGWSAGWVSFYDFFRRIDVVKNERFDKYITYLKSGVFMGIFLDGLVVICGKPSKALFDENKRLHKDNGLSVIWPDGYGMYRLHGVNMPVKYILTPPEKIDIEKGLKEKDVDVRREIIRKVGMDLLYQKLKPRVLDKERDYEVISFNFGEELKDARYLKMQNPSLPGVWHIEGVPNDIKTVDQALHSRKPENLKAIPIDDKNGEDYYAQGDVIIWNPEAKSVKSRPRIQT